MAPLARGFTLLEVLVVLVLIGIMTSFALLSVGRSLPERLAEEAQRLAALTELQQQEAILNAEAHGIHFSSTGYTFLRQNSRGRWQPPAPAGTLTAHNLPADMVLSLWVEGQPIFLKTPGQLPQVWLLPSGETTEFIAVFSAAEEAPATVRYRVTGDALGRLMTGAVSP